MNWFYRLGITPKLLTNFGLVTLLTLIVGVVGNINLGNLIVPIIDLRRRFNLGQRERDSEAARILVVDVGEKIVGFFVDAVREIIRVEHKLTDPSPDLTTSIKADYITAVAKLKQRLLIMLDLNKVLLSDEQEALAQPPELLR